MMIRKMMSVGHRWLGAFAFTIAAALMGSSAAVASVITPSAAISFPKKVKAVKTPSVKKKYRKAKYLKRRTVKSVAKKSGIRKYRTRVSKKVSKRRTYKKRRSVKRIAAKRKVTGRKSYKRRVAKKSYKKKSYKRKYARKSTKRRNSRVRGRGRGSLMATLRSVKPKGLPLRLAAAVVTVESGWRVNARGSSGERGLMQLMPATARMMGARGNLYNPTINMRAGTKYLNWCYRRARKNVAATIGCYNRGPGKMWKWSGNPITRRYVGKVRRYMRRS